MSPRKAPPAPKERDRLDDASARAWARAVLADAEEGRLTERDDDTDFLRQELDKEKRRRLES